MTQPRRTEQQTPVIPDKLYFRIGEVARLLKVETHTLRFWETEFPHLKVAKGGTGQRLYRRRDVEALLEIRQLLYAEGFTIPGARQHLAARTRQRPAQAESAEVVPAELAKKRELGLEKVREGLRSLSEQLAEAPARPSVRSQESSSTAQRHRGLHLAMKAGRNSAGVEVTQVAKPVKAQPPARDLFDGLDAD